MNDEVYFRLTPNPRDRALGKVATEIGGCTGKVMVEDSETRLRREIRRIMECNPLDYYTILGVHRSSNPTAIAKAYRRLVLLVHPDKCGKYGHAVREMAEQACQRVTSKDPNERN